MQVEGHVVYIRPQLRAADPDLIRYRWRSIPALGVIGALAVRVVVSPFIFGGELFTPNEKRLAILHQTRTVKDSILRYAAQENHGVIPAFSSQELPTWWDRYAPPGQLDSDVHFSVPQEVAGKSIEAVQDEEVLVTARGSVVAKVLPDDVTGIKKSGFFEY